VRLRLLDGFLNVDELQLRVVEASCEVDRELGRSIGMFRAIDRNEDSIHDAISSD
jgi:hypothetical protein